MLLFLTLFFLHYSFIISHLPHLATYAQNKNITCMIEIYSVPLRLKTNERSLEYRGSHARVMLDKIEKALL